MNKELYVSSTPHETKVGLVEDDQLAEVYFERENEYTLAGSIYKGRVTRVLPGMQSAFVDIGLERDAFLYVSDFLDFTGEEDDEEFGDVPVKAQFAEVKQSSEAAPAETDLEQIEEDEDDDGEEPEAGAEAAEAESTPDAEGARRWRGRRRRRGRRAGRERVFEPHSAAASEEPAAPGAEPESVAAESAEEEIQQAAQDERPSSHAGPSDKEPSSHEGMPASYTPIVLPGESIARYNRGSDGEPREERAGAAPGVPLPPG